MPYMQYRNTMTRSSFMKIIWVLVAALFLSAQGLAQAHSVSDGSADHSHDGVVCEACLASLQHTAVEPSPSLITPLNLPSRVDWDVAVINEAPRTFDGRAPPPRGPPAH